MNDALFVRGLERIGNLQRDAQRRVDTQRATLQPLGEGFAFDELHDEEMTAVVLLESVERRNPRVVQCSKRFGLPLEASDPLRIACEVWRKNLDRNRASELRIA